MSTLERSVPIATVSKSKLAKKQYIAAVVVVVLSSAAPSSPTITTKDDYGRPFEGCDGQGARIHMLVFVVDSTPRPYVTLLAVAAASRRPRRFHYY